MAGLGSQSILPPRAAFFRGDVLGGMALAALIMVFFLYGMLFGAQKPLLVSRPEFTIDAAIFYAAAKAAFVYGHSPYDYEFLRTFPDGIGRVFFGFFYPPPSLLFFAPLAMMDYMSGRIVMLIGGGVTAVLSAWLLLATAAEQGAKKRVIWLTAIALSLSLGLYNGLAQGQPNCFVFLFLLLFWRALRVKRDNIAGAALAAAGLLKFYPFLFALPLLLFKRRTALKWCVGTAAVLSAATLLFFPAGWWLEWAQITLSGGYGATPPGLFPVAAAENLSLNGWFSRTLAPNPVFGDPLIFAPALVAPLGYLSAALLVFLAARHWQRKSWNAETIDLIFAQSAFLMLLLAPFTWRHHFVFAAYAVVWLMLAARGWAMLALVFAMSLGFGFLMPQMLKDVPVTGQLLGSSLWAAWTLILFYLTFRLSVSRKRSSPGPTG